jgi:hypothetical protein
MGSKIATERGGSGSPTALLRRFASSRKKVVLTTAGVGKIGELESKPVTRVGGASAGNEPMPALPPYVLSPPAPGLAGSTTPLRLPPPPPPPPNPSG